jgi:pimeloyl-ACP methyl ester carboxylesterase
MRFYRIMKLFLILIPICYLGILAALFFLQSQLLFHPTLLDKKTPLSFSSDFSENFLKLRSGEEINYLIFRLPNPKGVILYFHGNAGALNSWGEVAQELAAKTKHEVWIMDFPGFGKSTGELPKNEAVLFEMGRAFLEEIKSKSPGLEIIAYGRSIGTGIASQLAVNNHLNGLILETPYTDLKDLAHENFEWVPRFLLRYDLNNRRLEKAETSHILIVHGTADEVIPYHHGEQLSALLKAKAQFVTIPGGKHNNLSDFADYWLAIGAFLERK